MGEMGGFMKKVILCEIIWGRVIRFSLRTFALTVFLFEPAEPRTTTITIIGTKNTQLLIIGWDTVPLDALNKKVKRPE